jgi:recombination protein RecT
MSNIVAVNDLLTKRASSIQSIAPTGMEAKKIIKIVLNAITKTPALQSCSPESVFRSVMHAVELGLTPGSSLGEAYLVPYGKECQLIPGYRGLITLARRSGEVSTITSYPVYSGDEFDFELGLNPVLRHIPHHGERQPSDITHVYCVIRLKDGGVVFDVMTRGEVDAVRKRSKAGGSGPWVTDYAEMARKTVTRRCLKYAPMSVEMSKALAIDTAADTGDMSILAEFGDPDDALLIEAGPTKADALKARLGDVPNALDTATGEVTPGQQELSSN